MKPFSVALALVLLISPGCRGTFSAGAPAGQTSNTPERLAKTESAGSSVHGWGEVIGLLAIIAVPVLVIGGVLFMVGGTKDECMPGTRTCPDIPPEI